MKIAVLGTRGVPASYSGFETCVEQVGARLVNRGHEVTVYCRSHHYPERLAAHRGMRLLYLPSIRNKHLDTICHTSLSALHALSQGYDAVLLFIVGNSPLAWIPRLARQKVVLNVDGLDWRRAKWGRVAKRYLRWTERIAPTTANAVVTDSRAVQTYYRDQYGADTTYIAYGAEVIQRPPGRWLARYGLRPREYVLSVGRLVPENCVHHLVEAMRGLGSQCQCAIVGDAPYAAEYIASLRERAGSRVVFTGYLFGEGYEELLSNALAFVETSGAGGTHPALLEAMAAGNCVVVNDTAENLETVGPAGLRYDGTIGGGSLRDVLTALSEQPSLVSQYRQRAPVWVAEHYDWERVVDAYEALLCNLVVAG